MMSELVKSTGNKTINILGTPYEIIEQSEKENPKLKEASGLCEQYSKKIILNASLREPSDEWTVEDAEKYRKKVLRHEIIHAFLTESGLSVESEWAENEEMVDWFAIQFERLCRAFREAGAFPDDREKGLEQLAKAMSRVGASVSTVKGDMDWVDERS